MDKTPKLTFALELTGPGGLPGVSKVRGDCEFTPGASLDVLGSTVIGGRLLMSTVDSLLALGGAGTRRYVPSVFFFNKNCWFAPVDPRRSAKCRRQTSCANVEFIAEKDGHVTSLGVVHLDLKPMRTKYLSLAFWTMKEKIK